MGDCRIIVLVDAALLQQLEGSRKQPPTARTFSVVLSSDSTVEAALQSLQCKSLKQDDSAKTSVQEMLQNFPDAAIWDTTTHPVQNVTSNVRSTRYVQTTTLFKAGWFPSGTLHLLASSTDAARYLSSNRFHDDYQFNNSVVAESSSSTTTNNTELQQQRSVLLVGADQSDGSLPLPSQVLRSVTERFADDDQNAEQQRQDALALKRARLELVKQAQAARHEKLDAKIKALQLKQSKASEQVQFMLIKSRATGRGDLSQDDRVYMQVVHDTDSEKDEEPVLDYRYFSQQDAVGRILATLLEGPTTSKILSKTTHTSELLVSFDGTYRRLPSTLRLYEALERGFLVRRPVPTVIVRMYDPVNGDATTSILNHGNTAAEMDTDDNKDDKLPKRSPLDESKPAGYTDTPETALPSSPKDESSSSGYERLAQLLTSDVMSRSKAKKKLSKSHVKVRQMQIKSKASGDSKRVKVADRFFVELYLMAGDMADPSLTFVGPKFAAWSDVIARLLQHHFDSNESRSWEVLAATISLPEGSISVRSKPLVSSSDNGSSLTWEEADRAGFVDCFDVIVLRFFPP